MILSKRNTSHILPHQAAVIWQRYIESKLMYSINVRNQSSCLYYFLTTLQTMFACFEDKRLTERSVGVFWWLGVMASTPSLYRSALSPVPPFTPLSSTTHMPQRTIIKLIILQV